MGAVFLKHPENAREQRGCEGCHGPAKIHAESGGELKTGLVTYRKDDPTPVEQRNQTCLECHSGGNRTLWAGAAHESRNVACTNCHTVMKQVSERNMLKYATAIETCGQCHPQRKNQMQRFAHMPLREGKMDCNSCHQPHGTASDKLLIASSVNETCTSCHSEKRGPYLWEHPPVVESCANCHDPHGSSNEKQLVVPRPRLCQRCHTGGHPGRPYPELASNSKFVNSRSCSNCHANIHGSNHPSGQTFTR
jgi:DmsE family decaheme c-type cytochrome